jgi:small subunit ribosomal protein S21|tara:strand:+ start:75 stop:308 length:234 start_codon:yes stop_codon:yes gene_type:complete
MTQVKPRMNPKTRQVESFDRMLRRFKKACDRKGIVKECRDREYFEKPAMKRNQRNQAIKRKKKLALRKAEMNSYRRR